MEAFKTKRDLITTTAESISRKTLKKFKEIKYQPNFGSVEGNEML